MRHMCTYVSHDILLRQKKQKHATYAQDTRDGEVVDIVSSHFGIVSLLTETSHPRIDQSRVPLQEHVRTKAESLHDTGTEGLDNDVGLLAETDQSLDTGRRFEVESDGAFVLGEDIEVHGGG